MKRIAVLACLALAACDGVEGSNTLPEGVSRADVALFTAAVTDAGCAIDRANAPEVKARTGFEDDKLAIITQYLTLAGESTPTASGFRLTSGSCANA